MRVVHSIVLVAMLASTALAQSSPPTPISTDEAYQRLLERQAQRQAASTQPAADQIAALQAENAKLRAIVADLQLQLGELKGTSSPGATAAPSASTYTPRSSHSSSYAGTPTTQQADQRNPYGEQQTGTTATGIPQFTGPRGGTYHYSSSG